LLNIMSGEDEVVVVAILFVHITALSSLIHLHH
jgi:hypothetical protein